MIKLLITICLISFVAQAETFFFDKIKAIAPPLPNLEIDPDSYENNLDQIKCTEADCQSWVQFMKVKLWSLHDKKKACELITPLLEQTKHPLYPVFLMKHAELCPSKQTEKDISLIDQLIEEKKYSAWLEAPLRKVQLKLGKKDKVLQLSKLLPTKKQREALLTNAINDPQIKLKDKIKIKKELWRISPRFIPKANLKTPAEKLAAAQDALNANDGPLAISLAQAARKQKNSDGRRALEIEKASLKMLQEKKEALKVAKKIFELDSSAFKKRKSGVNAKNLITSGLNYAKALWTAHQNASVEKTLKSLEKNLQNHYSLSEIYYLRARLAEEEGDFKRALKFLEIASQELPAGKDELKIPYLWNQAWFNYKNHQISEAVDIFKKIEASENIEQGRKLQAMFWLAKSLKALSLQKDAEKKFRSVIDEDPTSYYAFLSYRELGEKIPAVTVDRSGDLYAPSGFDMTLFKWLVSVGEFEIAQNMVTHEAPLKESASSDWPKLFSLYKEAQAFGPVFLKVIKLPPKDKVNMTVKNMDVLYPVVDPELVQKASATTGLWMEYLLAIIRQESSFDPLSQSPADAIGLMQVLPSVAKAQSKKHHIQYSDKNDLFDPAINISVGAGHLRDYWDMFQGRFVLATAAYNASPEAIKVWLRTRANPDTLVFIEDIPYEETRNYVKLVMRNFINYLRITSKDDSFTFPDWCLSLDN